MTKRLLFVGLILAVVLTLAGCGGGGTPKGTVVIRTGDPQPGAVTRARSAFTDALTLDLHVDFVPESGAPVTVLNFTKVSLSELMSVHDYPPTPIPVGTYVRAEIVIEAGYYNDQPVDVSIGGVSIWPIVIRANFSPPVLIEEGIEYTFKMLYGNIDTVDMWLFDTWFDLFDLQDEEDDSPPALGYVTMYLGTVETAARTTPSPPEEPTAHVRIELIPGGGAPPSGRCEVVDGFLYEGPLDKSDFEAGGSLVCGRSVSAGIYNQLLVAVKAVHDGGAPAGKSRTGGGDGWYYGDPLPLEIWLDISPPLEVSEASARPSPTPSASFTLVLHKDVLATLAEAGWDQIEDAEDLDGLLVVISP